MAINFHYFIKGLARMLIRIIVEIVHRLGLNLFDTLFGFYARPEKNLRIKIIILKGDAPGPEILPADLRKATDHAKMIFAENFNVNLLPAKNEEMFTAVPEMITPPYVFYTRGGPGALREEFNMAGTFFAANLAGPIYPVTVFVVREIKGATGCSLGPMTDYITLDHRGAKDATTLAHELAHACGLWHLNDNSNLLWNMNNRGHKIRWWQKNVFRGSRHITYW